MEIINNIQLKEVVRDYLLTEDPDRPMIIWGEACTGKMEIIDEVVAGLSFYKLLNSERKLGRLDLLIEEFVKSLNVNLGQFESATVEKKKYMDIFSCCRIISTNKSEKQPHVVIQADIKNGNPDQQIIDTVNKQCNALAYRYVLDAQDWCLWAENTRRIHPYYVRFIKQHPDCMLQYFDNPTSPYRWEVASKEVYRDMESNKIQPLHQLLYKHATLWAFHTSEEFKNWLEQTLGVIF